MQAKILWDYSNVRSGNPIRSIVEDVQVDCDPTAPNCTVFAQSVYGGQMGTGRKISFDTLSRDATPEEGKSFYELLCEKHGDEY
jgi:hypothetical protein